MNETLLQRAFRLMAEDNAPISFTMNNAALPAGGAIVFISADLKWGRQKIRIENSTAQAIPFDSTSVVRIYMSLLLSTAEIAAISVAGTEWTCERLTDRIELKPRQAGSLPPSGFVELELTSVLASGEAATANFRFEYAAFGGKSSGQRTTVFRQRPPGAGRVLPLTQELGQRSEYAGQHGNTVYATPTGALPIANYAYLQIANTDKKEAINLPEGSKPKITLSFVTGSTRACICSDEQLKSVELSIRQTDGVEWDIEKDATGPASVWNLRPKPGSKSLFKAGGLTSFQIGNLVTKLEPEWPSPLFLQFSGVPGYDDSNAVLFLQKTAPVPYVRYFSATANGDPVPYGATLDYGQQVQLTWDVFAAATCHIEGIGGGLPAKGERQVTANQLTNNYSLIAQIGGQQTQPLRIQFLVPPSSASLSASATLAKTKQEIELSWQCGSGACTLTGDGSAVTVTRTGTRKVRPDRQPCAYTITCEGVTRTSSSVSITLIPEGSVRVDLYNPFPLTVGPPSFARRVTWSSRWANKCVVSQVRTGEVISEAIEGKWEMGIPLQDYADFMMGRDRTKYRYRVVATGPGGTVTVEAQPG